MAPEQVQQREYDRRTLQPLQSGRMFYEMVAVNKAFDGESESLRQSILESEPQPPIQLNPKLRPMLRDLIMKALAKDPGERYQSGRGAARRSGEVQGIQSAGFQDGRCRTRQAQPFQRRSSLATQAKFAGASTSPAPPKPAPRLPFQAALRRRLQTRPARKKSATPLSAPGRP